MDDFNIRGKAKVVTKGVRNARDSAVKTARRIPGVKNAPETTGNISANSVTTENKGSYVPVKSTTMDVGSFGEPETKLSKFKPKHSQKEFVGKVAYYVFSAVVPVGVFFSVFFDLYALALVIVLISKWQIFLVKPRFWWANVKTSGVDLIFKLSVTLLMIAMNMRADQVVARSTAVLDVAQILLLVFYLGWNIYLRRKATAKFMMIQALSAQFFGAMAIAWIGGNIISLSAPTSVLIGAAWIVGYGAAQHSLYAYEESAVSQLASFWALTAALMTYLQIIWAKNFIFFGGLIYLPLLPIFTIGLGLLMSKAHELVEARQSSLDVSRTELESLKDNLEQVVFGALGVALLLSILIIFL